MSYDPRDPILKAVHAIVDQVMDTAVPPSSGINPPLERSDIAEKANRFLLECTRDFGDMPTSITLPSRLFDMWLLARTNFLAWSQVAPDEFTWHMSSGVIQVKREQT